MRKIVMKQMRVMALALVMATMLTMFFIPANVVASTYENDETDYQALIVDEADLLSSSEEAYGCR